MRKLSIIICVYNTPKSYLEECLGSLTETTLGGGASVPPVDYEILMIDDGSTENYSDLVEKYGVRYHKTENRGIFRARLLGIELAEGEYIAFCDSDDTVTFNYHRPMLRLAEDEHADIVINDWAFHTERSRYYCVSDTTISTDIALFGNECISAFCEQEGRMHSYYVLWNKLFSADVLKRMAAQVSPIAEGKERFNFSEDALMVFFAFKFSSRVRNLHTGYYFYRIHDSQSVSVISEARLRRQIECMGVTLSIMRDECRSLPNGEDMVTHIDEWSRLMSRTHYSHARGGGYQSLYPLIKQTYGVSELRGSTRADGAAYADNVLIGANIDKIDALLLKVFKEGGVIDSASIDPYALRAAEAMINIGGRVEFSKGNGTIIPKESISLKRKFYHIPIVYKLGMMLFPKGSRIRAFLKRRL